MSVPSVSHQCEPSPIAASKKCGRRPSSMRIPITGGDTSEGDGRSQKNSVRRKRNQFRRARPRRKENLRDNHARRGSTAGMNSQHSSVCSPVDREQSQVVQSAAPHSDHTRVGETLLWFQHLTANFIYCPNQFLDVCLPHSSRGVVRLVGYLLRGPSAGSIRMVIRLSRTLPCRTVRSSRTLASVGEASERQSMNRSDATSFAARGLDRKRAECRLH